MFVSPLRMLPLMLAGALALQPATASAAVQLSGPLEAPVMLAGFDTFGVRFRQLSTGGSQELYVGHSDLGTAGNRSGADLAWGGTNSFTISLADGTLSATVGGTTASFANVIAASGADPLQPFDTLQIGLRDGATGAGTFSLSGLTLAGTAFGGAPVAASLVDTLSGVDGAGFRYFVITGLDFAQDFSVSGTFTRAGAFGTTQEGNRVEFSFGNGPITQPAVPEPATWALLIAGFGLVGTALRRRQPRVA